MSRTLTEGAIIDALHNRRKSLQENCPDVAYKEAPGVDPKYRVTDEPKNPAGTAVEPFAWTMDDFMSKCSNCGAFFTTNENVSGVEFVCPECGEHAILEMVGEIESARLIECDSTDPNDGVVYSLAADVDDIISDDDLEDPGDDEDAIDVADEDDYEDDEVEDDEVEDVEEGQLLELKLKRKAIRGGKLVKLNPKTVKLKIKKAKRGKGFKILNGKIVKMTASERMRRKKAMKKVNRKGSTKRKRAKSMRKARRIGLVASLDFNRPVHIDEVATANCINEALNEVFDNFEDYIPFEITEITEAIYDAEADKLILEASIEYEDGEIDEATFEVNDVLTGTAQLTESSGDKLDLPVRILAESSVNDNVITLE